MQELASGVLADGLIFGEGPRWRDDRLWFSDMHVLLTADTTLGDLAQGRSSCRVRVTEAPAPHADLFDVRSRGARSEGT
jgi:hypothetical protein